MFSPNMSISFEAVTISARAHLSLSFSAHVLYRAFPLLSPHLFSATHDCDLPLGLNFRSALSQPRNVDDDVTYPWPPHTTFEFNRTRIGLITVGGVS